MNVYESVTERILGKLEAGVIPWRKTWASGLPKSLTTGKEYRGINVLMLGLADFRSRYWITFLETKRLGGFVRKGEKGSPVYYWHWRTEDEIEELKAKTGRDSISPCTLFTSVAFNLDQVEGIERPADDVPIRNHDPIEAAEKFLGGISDKPLILSAACQNPAYVPSADQILMPHVGQFDMPEEYYSTLFHELIHSTGHPKRLNRFAAHEGTAKERYSFEELVAEFGASFVCALVGISVPQTEELSAAYIKGWSEVLRKDKSILIAAASAAQKAVDFLKPPAAAAEVPETTLAA